MRAGTLNCGSRRWNRIEKADRAALTQMAENRRGGDVGLASRRSANQLGRWQRTAMKKKEEKVHGLLL